MSHDPNLNTQPIGKLLLRTMTMPADTNPSGDIFGGWIMSQMDIGGGILAKEIAQGRVVTAAVEEMSFYRPVKVGDVVCCYGKCVHLGRTSMRILIEVWVKKSHHLHLERERVTSAAFTYVATDENGKPQPIPRENNPALAELLS